MKYSCWITLFFTTVSCSKDPRKSNLAAGTYVGMESMGTSNNDVTPDDTTDQWYHENTLTIRGDSAFLQEAPIVIKDGQKSYSASDGGFYEYKGIISQHGDSTIANFLMTNHDYVALPYHLVRLSDSASTLSFDEQVKRGMLIPDSSVFNQSYSLDLHTNRIIMNGVEYKQKPD